MQTEVLYLLIFALAASVTLALTPVAMWLGQRFGVTTRPGGRRMTEGDQKRVSKLGGLALFGGFTIAVLAIQVLPVPRLDPNESTRLIGLLLGGAIIFAFGVLDDVFEFGPLPQFIGQTLAAVTAILCLIFIEYFNNPFTGQQTDTFPFVVTAAITFFWLIFMMNTMNFLDGLDGLAGGVTLIAGAMLFINSAYRVEPPQTSVSFLPLALMGTCAAWLLFNFYPARIFMGGGAQYLGFTLGALSIIGGAKMGTILLVLGLPLIDVVWQAVDRLRHGRSPFRGDRGHLHFRLLDMGFSQRQIVLGYYAFCLCFGALTLVTSSQLFKFIALAALGVIVALAFIVITRRRQSLVRAAAVSAAGEAGADDGPPPSAG
ncbi:MAG: undecaprenyl/decaprenyl-phosphate alpha-N-acetylglucosaminyl 1-phosphate transferase [Anaerolineae bacterium]|nr:undecaprenyl/decaprenyl-phosphate alpha-N-acetylglucosaminyl 1-phosphate transferase [Anaerolineae bacterium]